MKIENFERKWKNWGESENLEKKLEILKEFGEKIGNNLEILKNYLEILKFFFNLETFWKFENIGNVEKFWVKFELGAGRPNQSLSSDPLINTQNSDFRVPCCVVAKKVNI